MKQFIFRCLPLVLLAACNSNSTQNTAENADAAKTKVRADSTKAAAATKTVYTAGVDNLRIRETPTADGKVITTVKKGETLNLTGKKSTEKVTMDLQGNKVTDVFNEVNLAHGGQGWVFAACIVAANGATSTASRTAASIVSLNDVSGLITKNSIGGITPRTTEADLVKLFGKENIRAEKKIYANGDVPPFKGYTIYKGQPDELQIAIDPEKQGKTIAFVMVRNAGSKWHTAEGIRVGTTLDELNKINGKPFKFSGFGWDYGGYINDFQKGKLENLRQTATLRLDAEGLSSDFSGDSVFKSDNPGLKNGKITVSEISVDMFVK